ncbi:unnamed protein product [Tilletia controversa]|nr:unnamed protein product [Tilletia controversa]
MVLIRAGPSVLNSAKRDQLLASLQAHSSSIATIEPIFIHFVLTTDSSHNDGLEHNTLDTLLTYGDDVAAPAARNQLNDALQNKTQSTGILYVSPRQGSLSPWSSKATDIARICGLAKLVRRIERGIAYLITLAPDSDLSLETIASNEAITAFADTFKVQGSLQTFSSLTSSAMSFSDAQGISGTAEWITPTQGYPCSTYA